MRFPPEFLDEIRTRLPVSEVVGRRVRLKKAGREWRGLSPFNAEKTPSFFVNDGKMAWFDFSSGRNGNIFDFVMATEGVSFPEAVERLAIEAGVPLPQRTPESVAQDKRRAGLHEVLGTIWRAGASRPRARRPFGSATRPKAVTCCATTSRDSRPMSTP
jgi:DNA primase